MAKPDNLYQTNKTRILEERDNPSLITVNYF